MQLVRFIFLVLALLTATNAIAQDVVRLRATARVAPEREVTLGDIATIEGTQAELLRAIIVGQKDSGSRIDIASVRAAIDANKSINTGRVMLSGVSVEIVRASPTPAGTIAQPLQTTPATNGVTLREAIERAAPGLFGEETGEIRITFDDRDAELLATSLDGRTHTVVPIGKGEKPSLHVRVYEGDRLVLAQSTRVSVQGRRDVLVAARGIARGAVIDQSSTKRESRWLPIGSKAAHADESMGMVAKGAIGEGSVIESRQLDNAIVIRRGDLVAVDCMSGGIVVRNQMRARSDAKAGEVVELSAVAKPVSRDTGARGTRRAEERARANTVIRGRAAGPGRAVVVTSDAATKTEVVRSTAEQAGMDAPSSTVTGEHKTIVLPLHPAKEGEGTRP